MARKEKTIRVDVIKGPDRRRGGRVYEGSISVGHHAEITRGERIVLFGVDQRHDFVGGRIVVREVPYRREFRLGDVAEYDSYNLSYLGRVVSVARQRITIEAHGERHRLTLWEFDRRNFDLDVEKVVQANARTMETI